MALSDHVRPPEGRYDKVEAAYDGMDEADRETFRRIIRSPEWGHQEIAKALQEQGYNVDRRQVHHFREKLALERVKL